MLTTRLGAEGHTFSKAGPRSLRPPLCNVRRAVGLLDAAHIVPVEHPDGSDETSNGVALCALHHRAYDRGLVTFDEKYRISLSKVQVKGDFTAAGCDGGAEAFRKNLLRTLALPADSRLWPNPCVY